MALPPKQLTWDLSGLAGFAYNSSSAYFGSDRFNYRDADEKWTNGIYNPTMQHGYLSPVNSSTTSITGLDNEVLSMIYDHSGDKIYVQQKDGEIFTLDSSVDTSATSLLTITSGEEFRDMDLYEVGGKKSIVYLIDSLDTSVEGSGIVESGGMYVGYYTIDQDDGTEILDKQISTLTSGVNLADHYVTAVSDQNYGTRKYRKIAFEITSSDTGSFSSSSARYLSGVSLWIGRSGTATATIRVSLQGDASASVAPYTARGAWVTATAYAVNDTVTDGGLTYQCQLAHTSGASSDPGTGGSWEDYWSVFGAPDGNILGSDTIDFDTIPAEVSQAQTRIRFSWAPYNLTTANYWIVIEETTSGMGASDYVALLGTINSTGIYAGNDVKVFFDDATDYWRSVDPNGSYGLDNISFILHLNRKDNWSQNMAFGRFNEDTGKEGFLFVSDDGLLYWFSGNRVHTLDGSATGGAFGRASEGLLLFSSYTKPVSVAETRDRMYIAVEQSQPSAKSDLTVSDRIGVFVWDRRSQVVGSTDFYSCPGASKMWALFRSGSGNIMAITTGNGNRTELRAINGNCFDVVTQFGTDAHPKNRRGITYLDRMIVWLGADGFLRAWGSPAPGYPEALYQIFEQTGSGTFNPGPMVNANASSSNSPKLRFAYYFDTAASTVVKDWSPHTSSGTCAQGDALTATRLLPPMSTVKDMTIYCIPTGTGSDTIATMKFYFNMTTSNPITKTITKDMASRGYITVDINKHYVNAMQIEVEWAAVTTDYDAFRPSIGIVNYQPTMTHTPSKE